MTGTPEKTESSSPKTGSSPTMKNGTPTKVSPSKKASPTKDFDVATEACNFLSLGERHLFVNDIVDSLQEICRMAKQHGETATECGDAYFCYGRALLKLACIESGVLGNALAGVPEGDDLEDNLSGSSSCELSVEEKEKLAEQVGEALEENFQSLEMASSDTEVSESDDAMEDESEEKSASNEKADTAMDAESADKVSAESITKDGEKNGAEGEGKGEKTEEADDLSNLQLAWQMLELSKVIYQRQAEGDKVMAFITAQVFLKLSEVCLENENYPQSIEDLQSCLKLQETNMEADDRCMAETHYQLGVAHSFSDVFDKAIESFTKALKIIQKIITNLENTKKEGSPEEQADAETMDDGLEAEIKDSILLMQEIKEKITVNFLFSIFLHILHIKVKKDFGMASAIGGDAKPIDSSMIKKRKPDEEVGDEPKKTKAVNGN